MHRLHVLPSNINCLNLHDIHQPWYSGQSVRLRCRMVVGSIPSGCIVGRVKQDEVFVFLSFCLFFFFVFYILSGSFRLI